MSELEELEFDRRILNAAMNNTYLILTGRANYDDLLEKESMQAGSIDQHIETAVLFNPLSDNYNPKFPHLHNSTDSTELIDSMIEYFVETEEYEKCADLVKYKEKGYVKKR
tara:strand:+ start:1332 stop:1664 length:333 start_codon:yes stop_codon:yes gene_type:complete